MRYDVLPDSPHELVALRPIAEDDLWPMYEGRGIATAICAALTEWAHEHAGILRVQATTLASNGRSQRVLQRCGFEREGLLRSYRTVRGQPGDFWMYAHLGSPGR
jgi:[ribosomal protein S5]-alanine N-acetyltransferase